MLDDATTETADATPAAEAPRRATKSSGTRRGGKTGGRTSSGRAGSSRSRSGSSASRSSASSSSAASLSGTLAGALRDLVSSVENEVLAITVLSGQIDEHVEALNGLRAEATRRLLHLDDLRAAAEDVNLSAFLDATIQPQLPQSEEEFPERIYGG